MDGQACTAPAPASASQRPLTSTPATPDGESPCGGAGGGVHPKVARRTQTATVRCGFEAARASTGRWMVARPERFDSDRQIEGWLSATSVGRTAASSLQDAWTPRRRRSTNQGRSQRRDADASARRGRVASRARDPAAPCALSTSVWQGQPCHSGDGPSQNRAQTLIADRCACGASDRGRPRHR
jgi:hypothetical protein